MEIEKEFNSKKCQCCGQTTEYPIAVDQGSVDILKQIARFIEKKGINTVHPRKEMEGSYLTSNQVGNLSRLRIHGLITKVEENAGNYSITTKGFKFLEGEEIPKYAIKSKTEKRTLGYFKPDLYTTTISEVGGEYWEGINYEIKHGRVIKKEPTNVSLF